MRSFLVFGLLALAVHAEWYAARKLGDQTKLGLVAKGCFRGSYGLNQDLHLFNCLTEGLDVQPFATLSANSMLCVIEMKDKSQVMTKLSLHKNEIVILHEEEDEVVIGNVDKSSDSYPSLCHRDDFEGATWNVIVVPMAPMSAPNTVDDEPKADAPNPQITALLNSVSTSNLMSVINQLVSYGTRLSTTTNATNAVNWAVTQLRNYGFTVSTQAFRTGYCSNVIATKSGSNTSSNVVIGAHIDSRSENINNASAPAPGADDNGSGSAAILELARLVNSTGIRLTSNLILALFCGEEQGLYGSQYMAQQYNSSRTNIIGMYNADMIGYRCGSSITLTLDSRGVNTALTNTCLGVIPDYLNTYPIGRNSGCCSDNQSFENAGFPTVSFFECPGSNVDNPNYHKQSDTASTINQTQLAYVAKALYACALTQARPL